MILDLQKPSKPAPPRKVLVPLKLVVREST
jgi:hypothetical protein